MTELIVHKFRVEQTPNGPLRTLLPIPSEVFETHITRALLTQNFVLWSLPLHTQSSDNQWSFVLREQTANGSVSTRYRVEPSAHFTALVQERLTPFGQELQREISSISISGRETFRLKALFTKRQSG